MNSPETFTIEVRLMLDADDFIQSLAESPFEVVQRLIDSPHLLAELARIEFADGPALGTGEARIRLQRADGSSGLVSALQAGNL